MGDDLIVHLVQLIVFAVDELCLAGGELKVDDLFRVVADADHPRVHVGGDHSCGCKRADRADLWLHGLRAKSKEGWGEGGELSCQQPKVMVMGDGSQAWRYATHTVGGAAAAGGGRH